VLQGGRSEVRGVHSVARVPPAGRRSDELGFEISSDLPLFQQNVRRCDKDWLFGHMSQFVCVSCKHCRGPHLLEHVYIIIRAGKFIQPIN